MEAPKISVIVPIYKVEPYLRKCLDSIINQTYQNLEIILVDDGSPDCCGSICDEYAAGDRRVKVIHQPNGGLSAARNAGLEIATGRFLSFVDSDDAVSPVFIQGLLSAGVDVAQCGYTTELKKIKMDFPLGFEYLSGSEMSEKLCEEGVAANTVVWSKLWNRKCFERIRFPEGCLHEDEFVTWKILWHADSVARTKEPLYYYRSREGSIMNNCFSIHSLDSVAALRERSLFYEKAGAGKLSALSKAAFCHTLRSMWKDVSKTLPELAPELAKELKQTYREVLGSKELERRKKAALTLQMVCPQVYSTMKCHCERNDRLEKKGKG